MGLCAQVIVPLLCNFGLPRGVADYYFEPEEPVATEGREP
jgi:hypothetical protein